MSDPNGVKVVFIKKKAKGHGHHGGAWKVAYADFVTAMMALFIVLWLLTQSDQASKEKIAEYFRTGALPGGALMIGKPGGNTPPQPINIFPDGPGQSSAASVESKELKALAKAVRQMMAQHSKSAPSMAALGKHVKVRLVNEGALIELVEGGDNFLFNVASAELKPGAIEILNQLAPMLAGLDNKLEIHGHTDARPFPPGSKATNWQLSFERGDQARRVLEGQGVEKGKIQSVLAHADTALYNPDNPLAPENRRLSILVIRQSAQRSRAGLAGEGQGATKKPLEDDEDEPKKRVLDDDEDEPRKRVLDDEEDVPKKRVLDEEEDEPKPKKGASSKDTEPVIPAKAVSPEAIKEATTKKRRH
ncbi:MAG TPA: flagellar motor protein MotB [Polyangiales bacterium]|nr:flagellar motor protein MotB [Polyangiales bacterium]